MPILDSRFQKREEELALLESGMLSKSGRNQRETGVRNRREKGVRNRKTIFLHQCTRNQFL